MKLTDEATSPAVEIWRGCYGRSWRGLVVREAFSHPAKFSRGLIERIISEGLGRGWWRRGDLIGDPFAGVATGGIVCGYHGIDWIGVELEPRFVTLAQENLDLHRGKWNRLHGGTPQARIVQGDSRQFADIISASLDGIITSPPYARMLENGGPDHHPDRAQGGSLKTLKDGYGKMPGQISNLPEGSPSIEHDAATQYARETYWRAMVTVWRECFAAMRPGAILCVVMKDLVRDGARVPMADHTLALLQHIGFQHLTRIRALLAEEQIEPDLFGGSQTTVRQYKSLFRILAESRGAPPVDWEDVIIMRRPA